MTTTNLRKLDPFSAEYAEAAGITPVGPELFEELLEPPSFIVGKPITGNGMAAIRDWIMSVEQHFGGQNMATCHYAALLGYYAHLKTFRVEVSDRALAQNTGGHRSRYNGHAQRLVDAGLLVKVPKKSREKGSPYVLAERVAI
ncbi:hypothetical protein AD006_12345 [Pseudonocardia sp. EC080610-09]|uniref:hypothetical protein n=1 Tax=unclassified Pseudonocardia TaxID=2619320 RepID=UPI0006CB5583|nr:MULTISPECIES: hypothetical protein [unclassified Pseudonocardia]ALE72581.1 hypothetical protein FRP1_04685 [Pseudonocardia sp. EC080625-04]ALL75896.1 hypothetical protein AD006_12345 [Pseudonocardia sp. EC080610-09]ALL82923.1 hypothetical protein AD017_20175 [Pseudonocardia sp. EC080619-01]